MRLEPVLKKLAKGWFGVIVRGSVKKPLPRPAAAAAQLAFSVSKKVPKTP